MSLSDSDSPLSSPPSSELDEPVLPPPRTQPKARSKPKKKAAKAAPPKIKLNPPRPRSPSPPPRKRKKEPPHVPTLADSPELAFIVMFRSRFADAFKGVPNLGCQDIERGIADSTPSEAVEQLLCRLISLVLNRKKPVERGHHNRALEEVLHAHKGQWPRAWEAKSPISGGRSFADMDASQRLVLLKTLITWALTSSEQIRAIINENYKGSRRDDDLNVAISVQPWGRDGDKRRYWLIEGRDDTPFRLYRESNPALKNNTWVSIAGTIEEIRAVAKELEEDDGTKHALALKDKITNAILRFEEGENRRKKREYRASRKAFFQQPSGVSLYEGRTRGKRIKYTFSDEENEPVSEMDDTRSKRSGARSARATPQPEIPRYTASGRQVRKPATGAYGETKINGSHGTATTANGDANYGYPGADAYQGYGGADGYWNEANQDANDADVSESEFEFNPFDESGKRKSRITVLKINRSKLAQRNSQDMALYTNGQPPPIMTDAHGGVNGVSAKSHGEAASCEPRSAMNGQDAIMRDAGGAAEPVPNPTVNGEERMIVT